MRIGFSTNLIEPLQHRLFSTSSSHFTKTENLSLLPIVSSLASLSFSDQLFELDDLISILFNLLFSAYFQFYNIVE